MYYRLTQNNNGGFFLGSKFYGDITYIEADNIDDAMDIAESNGVYFGSYDTCDCDSCCAPRWLEDNIKPVNCFDKEYAEDCKSGYAVRVMNFCITP